MIKSLLLLGLAMTTLSNVGYSQGYKQIHQDLVVVDGHNDVIYESIFQGKDIGQRISTGATDLPRLREGGVDVQVFAVWSDDAKWKSGAFKHANDQIDALEKMIAANADKISLAKSSGDIDAILKTGKIVALIGVEGGNMIEGSVDHLVRLHERGAKYLTLTWNYNLPWASCAAMESGDMRSKDKGLTAQGRAIIRKMNELGMMIDLSHGGEQTFYDVLSITTKPILVSHSNAYGLCPHFRNLKDEQLEALKKNGGVVGVNFYSGFLDPAYETRLKGLYTSKFGDTGDTKMSTWAMYEKLPKELQQQADAPLSKLLDHIDYLVKKVGIDHVAVGSDFDGIESSPQGLEDVSKFPLLTKALLERGYTKTDVAKIMGQNFLRILKENEG
ncbi:dipeptidase [Sphingobacterium sp. 40-24]|mgnify:CR=1 FL=1|uniref:dipeptidase n=1 Tax=Sphingobacterium sp. 40-24 TaxID=1895843 RepID=UPI000969A177|nr:dipeptidase [Sphingobacterium sp. 40-24]OJZ13282.1 MAG: membrane dipeptidase [Sphingobacterium sp. 40-24]